MPEIQKNALLFVIGSNTTETHPIVGIRMKRAVRNGAELIVADPRRINLVRFARLWLQHRPGTDVALLNSMMHVILAEGLEDRDFISGRTEGFESFRAALEEFTPDAGEKITGVPKDKIIRAARMYAGAERAGIYYTMGITQHTHGTDNVYSVANLALLTGNLGKEGAGVNPLRGQNNVQGASDMACAPNVFPGYQKVDAPGVREKFEQAWGAGLSGKVGITATEMVDGALAGSIKAMYIMGENPVLSDPDMHHTVSSLEKLDFLVVQDIFLTETAQLADVVLPAAAFPEKEGTFTNTERRVQRVRRAVAPPGEAKEDSWIIAEISRRLGYPMQAGPAEEIFREIGAIWPAVAGITYDRIENWGIQWPCPAPDHPGTPYLFKDGFPRGKGRFTPVAYRPSAEIPDAEFPFVLSTGRQLFQYHTGTMTRRTPAIETVASRPSVEINPEDAKTLALRSGDIVRVSSRRGSIEIAALVTEKIQRGMVFIPFHFREAAANVLTNTATDPVCKIPELKVCAVRVEPVPRTS